jgi:TolB-like protein/DNA-binding winged helix-turn-helix (wHTH) protein
MRLTSICHAAGIYSAANDLKMVSSTPQIRRIRFGAFEVDLVSNQIFKHGIRIKLQDQPFQILTVLLQRHGELILREELRRKLWADDTFVDFDAGMNAAIRRLRDALSDSADQPRYIETLPRHGYRFIAEVETVAESDPPIPANTLPGHTQRGPLDHSSVVLQQGSTTVVPTTVSSRMQWIFGLGLTLALATILTMGTSDWRHHLFATRAASSIQSIAVLPLRNLSGDPSQDYFADGMTEALITDLAQIESLRVISATSSMYYKGTQKGLPQIAKDLNVDVVVEGVVVRSGDQVRIDAQLIRTGTDRHIWARSYDRKVNDVLSLQADVAQAIATEIEAKLTSGDQSRLAAKKRIVDPKVYEALT